MGDSSPEWKGEESVDFRAPPPSPVASGRRSSVSNAEVLSQFIENSVRVPDLVLPDKVFPKLRFVRDPPTIDFLHLGSAESQIQGAMASVGCFQVVNHGVPEAAVKAAMATVHRTIFGMPMEKRLQLTRFGFDDDDQDEFVWSDAQSFMSEMEGLRLPGYSHFRALMEELTADTERIGDKIVKAMTRAKIAIAIEVKESGNGEMGSRVWCLRKHSRRRDSDHHEDEGEAMRMLIRGFDHSHALCLHFCEGSSVFHVYSKKGWICFRPLPNALLVTVGDQFQVCSGGKYKQVVGRAIHREDEDDGDELRSISMAFLYSQQVKGKDADRRSSRHYNKLMEKTISIRQQLLFALFLSLFFRFCLTFHF